MVALYFAGTIWNGFICSFRGEEFYCFSQSEPGIGLGSHVFFLRDQDEIIKIFCTGHHKLHSAKFSFNWPPELIKM
jgi:hypothetical protein